MKKLFTPDSGAQVSDDRNSITAGERSPVLMQGVHLIKLVHFYREQTPERVRHAKGVVLI